MASLEQKTQHVIVVMLENRSFDHLLGMLDHPKQFENLPPGTFNEDRSGNRIFANRAPDRTFAADASHHHEEVMEQVYGERRPRWPYVAKNDGFVKVHEGRLRRKGIDLQHLREVMDYYESDQMPVLSSLAKSYVLFDHWFSSMPGPTWPNRHFTHAGTSFGMNSNNILRAPSAGPTVFSRLIRARRDWIVYADGLTTTWFFDDVWRPTTRDRFRPFGSLLADIAADQLPDYAFVDPDHFGSDSYSEHPARNIRNDRDFRDTEQKIHAIHRALELQPDVFDKTVLLITYDEHGGLHDHVAPPELPRPDRHEAGQFRFDVGGVRVPAVLVSPWAPPATVNQHVYDHTSIINTVRQRFAPAEPRLTERDGNARVIWKEDNLSLSAPLRNRGIAQPESTAGPAFLEVAGDQEPEEDERDYESLARYVDQKLTEEQLGVPLEAVPEEKMRALQPRARTKREIAEHADRVAERFRRTAPNNVRLRTPEGFTIVNPTTEQFEMVVGRTLVTNGRAWIQDSDRRSEALEPRDTVSREETVNRFTDAFRRMR
jgi:phospholipase C